MTHDPRTEVTVTETGAGWVVWCDECQRQLGEPCPEAGWAYIKADAHRDHHDNENPGLAWAASPLVRSEE